MQDHSAEGDSEEADEFEEDGTPSQPTHSAYNMRSSYSIHGSYSRVYTDSCLASNWCSRQSLELDCAGAGIK